MAFSSADGFAWSLMEPRHDDPSPRPAPVALITGSDAIGRFGRWTSRRPSGR
ncbi:hypothetical protein ACWD4G_29835 [Streptomyces sp. NPDC002643]